MLGSLALPAALLTFAVLVVVAAALNPATRLTIAAALALPQLFIPAVPLPLAQVWMLALLPAEILDRRSPDAPSVPGRALVLGLVLITAVSVSWSPDREAAVGAALRLLMFAGVLWTAARVAAGDRAGFARAAAWAAPGVLLQAGLTILFRLDPASEEAFLTSPASFPLVGPAGRELYGDLANNVIDPLKAGGVFVNGNVASMFLGVAATLYFAVWRRTGRRRYGVVAAASLAGTVATGSKTGIALAIALPALGLLLSSALDRRSSGRLALTLIAAAPVVAFANWVARSWADSFSDRSAAAYTSREQLWSLAWELFGEEPVFGLGEGGWATHSVLPPHNFVIAAWASAGLAAATLTVLVMARVLAASVRAMAASRDAGTGAVVAAVLGWMWIFVHGMGDNTAVYGETHTMALAAMLTGVLVAPINETCARPPESEGGRRPTSRGAGQTDG